MSGGAAAEGSMPDHVLVDELHAVAERAGDWLEARRASGGVGFAISASSLLQSELNATTVGVELWAMLRLPLSDEERRDWLAHLCGYQIERTGLVADDTWRGRQLTPDAAQVDDGDTFFTMTTTAAVESLGGRLPFPVRYLADLSPDELLDRIDWEWVAHARWGVGDLAPLVRHNRELGVAGADDQWSSISRMLVEAQDPTGFWPAGSIAGPPTPHINRTFHVLRSTWNVEGRAVSHAARLIDACLAASRDQDHYGWESGYACNDLDLAHVAFSAASWDEHRRDELAEWARAALPQILAVEKPGGGFSFHHETAMTTHAGITMTTGTAEADMWGTLMYLGAIKMMVGLGWRDIEVPWGFSTVHAIPRKGRP